MNQYAENEAAVRAGWEPEACAEVGEGAPSEAYAGPPAWEMTPVGRMPRGTFAGSDRRANTTARGSFR